MKRQIYDLIIFWKRELYRNIRDAGADADRIDWNYKYTTRKLRERSINSWKENLMATH
jgi:hypothetical protein